MSTSTEALPRHSQAAQVLAHWCLSWGGDTLARIQAQGEDTCAGTCAHQRPSAHRQTQSSLVGGVEAKIIPISHHPHTLRAPLGRRGEQRDLPLHRHLPLPPQHPSPPAPLSHTPYTCCPPTIPTLLLSPTHPFIHWAALCGARSCGSHRSFLQGRSCASECHTTGHKPTSMGHG